MKEIRRQLGMTAMLIAVIGASEAAWAGDYDLLQQEADIRGQPLEDYMRSLRSGDFEEVPSEPPRRRAEGALRQVQLTAEVMLDGRAARAWGWAGTLTPEDLTNDFATFSSDGVRAFNVLDAEGFYERFKCNLFVFELAYRSGLRVPLMGRSIGWGYIGPSEVLRQIEREHFDRGWAFPHDESEIDELREATHRGIPFILVGEGSEGRAGHMGMVDEFHVIERNDDGAIHRVVYSGWEANGDGAHYRRRTWGLWRFESIHILELQEPESGQAQCFPIDRGPTLPSAQDVARAIVQVGAGSDVIIRAQGIDLDGFEGGPTRESSALQRALATMSSPPPHELGLGSQKMRRLDAAGTRTHEQWAKALFTPRATGIASLATIDMQRLFRLVGLTDVFRRSILPRTRGLHRPSPAPPHFKLRRHSFVNPPSRDRRSCFARSSCGEMKDSAFLNHWSKIENVVSGRSSESCS